MLVIHMCPRLPQRVENLFTFLRNTFFFTYILVMDRLAITSYTTTTFVTLSLCFISLMEEFSSWRGSKAGIIFQEGISAVAHPLK